MLCIMPVARVVDLGTMNHIQTMGVDRLKKEPDWNWNLPSLIDHTCPDYLFPILANIDVSKGNI